MQVFSKDLVARNRSTLIKNRYDKEVDETKDKVIKMQNISFTEYSTSKQALQYYYRGAILVGLGIVTSAISYPLSVRIVKKIFNLKQFINIHLAAVPIIVNINAFVLGTAQGYINYYLLLRKYPQQYASSLTIDLL